jgi:DNA topoisomerase-1
LSLKKSENTFTLELVHGMTIHSHSYRYLFGWGKCPPIAIIQEPNALVIKENHEFRKLISSLAKNCQELWLATDPDSEGDNIAYEAYLIAIRVNPLLEANTLRIWNSSLTKKEILRAFKERKHWSIDLALAVQGRRITDAWVGFAGTREVTLAVQKVRKRREGVLSVGRVQLPTLKIIVSRTIERENFKMEEKYNLLADLLDNRRKHVLATVKHIKSPFESLDNFNDIYSNIKGTTIGKITQFDLKKTSIPPIRPMNTTDAIALLSRQLKIKADDALAILSVLYEEGFISYPRTENRNFKNTFPHKEILHKLQQHPPYRVFFSKIITYDQVRVNGRKQGTEDHDPIHPTGDIPTIKGKIMVIHLKSWTYIARWYLGMFMEDLIQQRGIVSLQIKEEPFKQKYQTTESLGWTESMIWKKPRETPSFTFTVGQIVQVKDIRQESFKTKPPSRWNDASLIRRLEVLKIGTKSSRPEIIKKLELRQYIKREGTSYDGTTTGKGIIRVFDVVWPDLVTPKFTRQIEQHMDEIATKKVSYENTMNLIRESYLELHKKLIKHLPVLQELFTQVKDFETDFNSTITQPKRPMQYNRVNKQLSSKNKYLCPDCNQGTLLLRTNSKTNEKFFGCSQFPNCRFTTSIIQKKDQTSSPAIFKKRSEN